MIDDSVRVCVFNCYGTLDLFVFHFRKHVEEFALNTQFPYYLIRLAIKIDFVADFPISTPSHRFKQLLNRFKCSAQIGIQS